MADRKKNIAERVHMLYVEENLNCEKTTLEILEEKFGKIEGTPPSPGAWVGSGYCGLLRGGLSYLVFFCGKNGLDEKRICPTYLEGFRKRFKSLLCRELRGQNIQPCDPPRVCEGFITEAILYDIDLIESL